MQHLEPVELFHKVSSITRGCATLNHCDGGRLRPRGVQSTTLLLALVFIHLVFNLEEETVGGGYFFLGAVHANGCEEVYF